MGTLNNPGRFDCIAKIGDDEPYFMLRAKDLLAPKCVRDWAARAAMVGTPPEKVAEAVRCADAMEAWGKEHGARVPN